MRITRTACAGPGKFEGEDSITEYAYGLSADDEAGHACHGMWYGYYDFASDVIEVAEDGGSVTCVVAMILTEDSQGFVGGREFTDILEARGVWDKICASDPAV